MMSEICVSKIWSPYYNMEYTNRSHIMSNHSKTTQHITVNNYWSITKLKSKESKGKGHPCTGTEALYRLYGL